MTETAADEQDLAKALDSVANAATTNYAPSNPLTPDSGNPMGLGSALPPIVPPNSPVAPAPTEPVLPSNPLEDAAPAVHSVHNAPGLTDSSDGDDDSDDTSNDENDDSRDSVSTSASVPTGPLADIKSDALNELRPLVDKLNVSAEEKFDTYLLLIRSTDDSELIAPAHEAAKAIEDEARRAEALLDIIKEIDYLSRQDKSDN